jgi:hypothetical protein
VARQLDQDTSRGFRAYSIVSSPYEQEVEFFFELVPQGELTPLLYRLNQGDSDADLSMPPVETMSPAPQPLTAFLCAVAAGLIGAASRMPFLLHADRFFDSDQAVEGLMARHVLAGEHPIFFWGQLYKGVPEVYLSALVFRFSGSGIEPLKAVTLFLFGLYILLNFLLIERVFSRTVAVIASALSIAAPPAFVHWTVSANAEIVLTMICGTLLLLALESWTRTRSRSALAMAGASVGLGLWIQQYILFYVLALAATWLASVPPGNHRKFIRSFFYREQPRWQRWVVWTLAVLATAYTAFAIQAFLSDGIHVTLFGRTITATHPQKLIRIGLLLGLAALSAGWLFRAGVRSAIRLLSAPGLGFTLGYAPVLWSVIAEGRFGALGPIGRTDARRFATLFPIFTHEVLPILVGMKAPDTQTLVTPSWWILPTLFCMAACLIAQRRYRHAEGPARDLIGLCFFGWFVVVAVIAFLLSGSFGGSQTYRYLVILYAALPVIFASGIIVMPRVYGSVVLIVLITGSIAQQAKWYAAQPGDWMTPALIRCLDQRGLYAAYADYWVSYKLTFVSEESIIVAPFTSGDRYPAYTRRVEREPVVASIAVPPPAGRVVEEEFNCRGVPIVVSRLK